MTPPVAPTRGGRLFLVSPDRAGVCAIPGLRQRKSPHPGIVENNDESPVRVTNPVPRRGQMEGRRTRPVHVILEGRLIMAITTRILATAAVAGILTGAAGTLPASAKADNWFKAWKTMNVVRHDSSKPKWVGTTKPDIFVGQRDAFATQVRGDPKKGKGAGDVFIPGSQLKETFIGGGGADTYIVLLDNTDGFNPDTIRDFKPKDGDRIDLSLVDARSKVAGHQSFRFIGEKEAFEGETSAERAGQLRFWDGYLIGTVDGLEPDEPDDLTEYQIVLRLDGVEAIDSKALILKSKSKPQLAKKRNAVEILLGVRSPGPKTPKT
jgi:hypothetical protein